ncbi:MAG: hypothetical protein OIF32_12630, partial [Campylobacterales bacterium]|nr:hypothetical protein [Campylobacterales bacterium]
SGLREAKLAEILAPLGHKNVTNITVFKTSKVEDPDTRKKGLLYSLQFTDLDLQKECKGFVYQDNKRKFQKDIDCK